MPSGFLGGGWIGPTAFGGGGGVLADPVPVAGPEIIVNRTFDDASWWLVESDWTVAAGVATHTTPAATGSVYRNSILTTGVWYQSQFEVIGATAGRVRHDPFPVSTSYPLASINGNQLVTDRAGGPYMPYRAYLNFDGAIDNLSLKPLLLSSLLSTLPCASADCDLSAAVTRTAGTQAGLVARLDSAASPANFIIAYLDGAGNVKVDKCVAGTYTNVIGGAVTYAAGRVLRLVCSGNDVSCYYNGAQVGATQTVADAGIVSNVRHGKFSTYAANTFADYIAA
jgi:hypothetical protein